MKRALVISGGGSKGAFAGGVAEYLLREKGRKYDIFVGSSTGSLLISHLALGLVDRIKEIYTSVEQQDIFDNCPFSKKNVDGIEHVGINHFNVLKNFLRGSKTFGESHNLRKLIERAIDESHFKQLKTGSKEIIVTVSNLSENKAEYKQLRECNYQDFIDWVWISCNLTPFMSLVNKDGKDYADGGLGVIVPISEAVRLGAQEIDVIVLDTEVRNFKRMPSKNPFSLLTNMFAFMLDRISDNNIRNGIALAKEYNAKVKFYYTPTVLTTNSLIFKKSEMQAWWKYGYEHTKALDLNH